MNSILADALDHPLAFDDYAEAVAHGFVEEAVKLQELWDYDYSFRLGDALVKAKVKDSGLHYTVLELHDEIDQAVLELLAEDTRTMGHKVYVVCDLNRYGESCTMLHHAC